jgi:uncharacterized SAM-binding protein YcdF (DUF218 family)
MSFLIAKLVWALAAPGTVLLILLVLALLLRRRRPRSSTFMMTLAALILAVAALCPLTNWVADPLERRFTAPTELANVDGIVVLGGALGAGGRGPLPAHISAAGDRITAAVELAREYPNARLVYTGGSGNVRDQGDREADYARTLLEAMGVDPARMIFERDSRDTWENALYSKKAADPKPGEVWLLVTSAWHMPRSVGCFRKAGWQVVPYPVDYLGERARGWRSWAKFDAINALRDTEFAEKEWIGLIAYHLMGRTDAWFPAPGPAH